MRFLRGKENFMRMPMISVIFPIYNNEKYIERCIRSVMNQTLKDIEMILIDDGSNDNAPQICDDMAKEDERIRVIHKKNEGVAVGENLGIELAKGEYIAFVEADDYVVPEMYEVLFEVAKKTNADIVKSGFYYNDGILKEVTSLYKVANEYEVFEAKERPALFLHHASMWAGIYKTSFLKENGIRNIETPSASYTDFSWMAMTYAKAKKITIVHRALYVYTYDNPYASNKSEDAKCFYKPFHCIEANNILKNEGVFSEVKEAIGYHEYRTCLSHAKRIKEEFRHEYFLKFREVMKEVCNGAFYEFKYFAPWEKRMVLFLLEDQEETFYKLIDRGNFINKKICPLKKNKVLRKISWILKQALKKWKT